MVFLPAKRDPAAWVLGEEVRVLRRRLNRTLDQPAMEAGISGFFVAGGGWSGFVITDLARGYDVVDGEVSLEGKVLVLQAGDSAPHQSAVPYSWNDNGSKEAVFVQVGTPR